MFPFKHTAVLSVLLVSSLTAQSALADTSAAFAFVDANNDSTLEACEVVDGLSRFGIAFGTSNTLADFDASGLVDFADFAQLRAVVSGAGHDHLLNAFVYTDTDGNLTVSEQEAIEAFERFEPMIGAVGKRQLNEDFDRSGIVDFADFALLNAVIHCSGHTDAVEGANKNTPTENAYAYIDANGDKEISAEEVVDALGRFGAAFGTKQEDADFDCSGLVDFADFGALTSVIVKHDHQAVLNAFQFVDADGDLLVSRREFFVAYKKFVKAFRTNDLIADFDESGTVDFVDFGYIRLFR